MHRWLCSGFPLVRERTETTGTTRTGYSRQPNRDCAAQPNRDPARRAGRAAGGAAPPPPPARRRGGPASAVGAQRRIGVRNPLRPVCVEQRGRGSLFFPAAAGVIAHGRRVRRMSPRPAKRGEGARAQRGRERGRFRSLPSPGSRCARATLSRKRERGSCGAAVRLDFYPFRLKHSLRSCPRRRGTQALYVRFARWVPAFAGTNGREARFNRENSARRVG